MADVSPDSAHVSSMYLNPDIGERAILVTTK
jgi:hypothetical protein